RAAASATSRATPPAARGAARADAPAPGCRSPVSNLLAPQSKRPAIEFAARQPGLGGEPGGGVAYPQFGDRRLQSLADFCRIGDAALRRADHDHHLAARRARVAIMGSQLGETPAP